MLPTRLFHYARGIGRDVGPGGRRFVSAGGEFSVHAAVEICPDFELVDRQIADFTRRAQAIEAAISQVQEEIVGMIEDQCARSGSRRRPQRQMKRATPTGRH